MTTFGPLNLTQRNLSLIIFQFSFVILTIGLLAGTAKRRGDRMSPGKTCALLRLRTIRRREVRRVFPVSFTNFADERPSTGG